MIFMTYEDRSGPLPEYECKRVPQRMSWNMSFKRIRNHFFIFSSTAVIIVYIYISNQDVWIWPRNHLRWRIWLGTHGIGVKLTQLQKKQTAPTTHSTTLNWLPLYRIATAEYDNIALFSISCSVAEVWRFKVDDILVVRSPGCPAFTPPPWNINTTCRGVEISGFFFFFVSNVEIFEICQGSR